jgi:hypothetical protein
MKHRIIYILTAMAIITGIHLLQWEFLPKPLQDGTDGYAASSHTVLKNDLQAHVFSPGLNAGSSAKNSDAVIARKVVSRLDPTTILLLSCGLIGLAGLRRRRIEQ